MAKELIEHDETLVESATLRASIMGWLKNHPGQHGATDIAEGMGFDRGRVAYACSQMADSGLIGYSGGGGRGQKVLYFGLASAPADTEPMVKRSKSKHVKDIELVLAGVEIVIGRNPATGRIRITLEA